MRPKPIHKLEAFNLLELMIVIVVVIVLLSVLLPFLSRAKAKAPRIECINHLKEIGTAYRIWSNDHHDRFPSLESVSNGGWSEFLTRANEGFMCWINYAIMSNELGQSPKIHVCPEDEREPADGFGNFVSNITLSYLVGMSTDDTYPQSLLGGDRNLGGGIQPDGDYGFSPKNGQGNDVAIQTNSKAGPVCWSLKVHSHGNSEGVGNILLGDGSAQQVTSAGFRTTWQTNFAPTTTWPAGNVPSSPSIRVLFP
jgi:competence protein ComGC